MPNFNPASDIPDLSGKVIFITGGTNGLGKQTILALAKHSPEHIYFTGRNSKSAEAIIQEAMNGTTSTKLTFIESDQLSLASVQTAAKSFLAKSRRLDILICNAGVMATDAALSTDGYENQFAVNHLAHALFVKLLSPILLATASAGQDVRVLFLTSTGFLYPFPGGIQFDALKTTQDFGPGSQWARYGQSKLANVQYPAYLAREHPSVTWLSVHPGVVATDLVGRLKPDEKELVYSLNPAGLLKPEEGIYNTCWGATTEKSNLKNGELYLPVGQKGDHSKESSDESLQKQLWDYTNTALSSFS